MGYSAYILISLVNIPEHLKTLDDEKLNDVLMDKHIPEFKQTYEELKDREFYSLIGPKNYVCSGGAWNVIESFKDEITLFTSKHPEFTFGIYFFYSDLTVVKYWEVKNDTILLGEKYDELLEGTDDEYIEFPKIKLKVNIEFNPNLVNIPNNITDLLCDKCECEYHNGFNFNN